MLDAGRLAGENVEVGALYLFTWNLRGRAVAHDLALDHLAKQAVKGPFVACLQELPGDSAVAEARREPAGLLASRGIAVVRTKKMVRGVAMAHHPALTLLRVEADQDDEFLAAVFRLPSSGKEVGIVGVHAKSKVDMHKPEDHGGSRALLRHAVHALRLRCDHLILMGDFNSGHRSREMQSWHGFYALSTMRPVEAKVAKTRRGFDHPPLSVVTAMNDATGTWMDRDTGGTEPVTADYIVTDAATRVGASSMILTRISGKSIWNAASWQAEPSDHLPVEGSVDI